jgi:hypothetical protein
LNKKRELNICTVRLQQAEAAADDDYDAMKSVLTDGEM